MALRFAGQINYEIVGPEYPPDEMVECVGVGMYANVYVLEERHRAVLEGAAGYMCIEKAIAEILRRCEPSMCIE